MPWHFLASIIVQLADGVHPQRWQMAERSGVRSSQDLRQQHHAWYRRWQFQSIVFATICRHARWRFTALNPQAWHSPPPHSMAGNRNQMAKNRLPNDGIGNHINDIFCRHGQRDSTHIIRYFIDKGRRRDRHFRYVIAAWHLQRRSEQLAEAVNAISGNHAKRRQLSPVREQRLSLKASYMVIPRTFACILFRRPSRHVACGWQFV